MDKKVYIFGAGASAPARLPMQNRLLKEIYSLEQQTVEEYCKNISLDKDYDFMDDTFGFLVLGTFENFESKRRLLSEFLVICFGNEDDYFDVDKTLSFKEPKHLHYKPHI